MIVAWMLITTRSPKLILDENIPREIALKLQQAGQDISYIREEQPGMDDEDIIAKSAKETRLIVTLDKDFGLLVFNRKLKPFSVLLLRIYPVTMDRLELAISSVLASITTLPVEIEQKFMVYDGVNLRIRSMP
ncbi:MAG: DUF5615 family PIN-like protein [Candidatus Sigynarchaeota archaeon]